MFTRGYPAENSWCLWMLSPFRWSHFEVLTHLRFCINQPLHLPFTNSFTHKSPAVKLLRPPSLLRRFCKGSKPNDLRYLSNFVLEKWEKSKIPPSSGRNSDENLPVFTCKNKLNFWDDTTEVGIHVIQVHAQTSREWQCHPFTTNQSQLLLKRHSLHEIPRAIPKTIVPDAGSCWNASDRNASVLKQSRNKKKRRTFITDPATWNLHRVTLLFHQTWRAGKSGISTIFPANLPCLMTPEGTIQDHPPSMRLSFCYPKRSVFDFGWHGSLNVPIEHHPTIRYMVYNGYYKVMSNIPKMGQLPTPVGGFFQHSKVS